MSKKVEKPLKKNRVDTAVKKEKVSCFPLEISANNVETVVLLLETAEDEILIQVLRSLCKYAGLSIENVVTLYNLNVMKVLWRIVDHPEVGVRRYSLKLLAQLHSAPGALEILLEDDDSIAILLDILVKNQPDKFIQEFSALIFAKLTESLKGCNKVIHTELIDFSFGNLISIDPDVRKNYLQIIMNVLKDPEGADIVAERIQWEPMYQLIRDRYVDIQELSLRVTNKLLCRQKDFLLQESFKTTNGLTALLNVLETYALKHLHPLVLGVLKDYSQTDASITNFYESGCLTRFVQYIELAPLDEKPLCLAVFLKIAMNKKGREMLHMSNIEQVICEVLADAETSLWGAACQAAILMSRHCRSAGVMVDNNIIQSVTSIVQNDLLAWEHVKEDCVLLLAELFRVEKKASHAFIELNGHVLLRRYLEPVLRADITQTGQQNIIQCFINMEAFQDSRQVLMNEDFFKEIMKILKDEDSSLNNMLCEVLCGLMMDNQGKEYFLSNKGVPLVGKLLADSSDDCKEACCRLITMSADEMTTPEYIKEGILHLLTENWKLCTTCPIWQMAIETLLSYHLPAKFHYTKELGYDDVTKQNFYAMKKSPTKFPEFEQILEEHSSMRHPVYFCHFVNESDLGSTITFNVPDASHVTLQDNSQNFVPSVSKLNVILNDHRLTIYLRKIQNIMVQHCLNRDVPTASMRDKVEILGKFVGEQMCGPDDTLICNNHLIDLHQNELRVNLGSDILPMGLVRVGGHFERAVLFKVLADNLEIPAKLCRGHDKYIWIEVSILPISKDRLIEQELMVNWNLLRSTHTVDLMDAPGSLLPMGSVVATHYCGQRVPLY